MLPILPAEGFSDDEVRKRFQLYYGNDPKKELQRDQIPLYRTKLENLSEFVREIKQGFSRFYNKRHKRKGFFWAERFKSLLVENGDSLINCLAYIDLNPVRAGIVTKPEEYRWSSLGYHVQTNNKEHFLSLEFGFQEHINLSATERFDRYRAYVYEKGGIILDATVSGAITLPLSGKGSFSLPLSLFHRQRHHRFQGIHQPSLWPIQGPLAFETREKTAKRFRNPRHVFPETTFREALDESNK